MENMVIKADTKKPAANFGIHIKLLLGFSVVLLLTLLVGGVGYYGVNKINLGADDLSGHWLKATSTLSQVVEDTEDTRRILLLAFTMRHDPAMFQKNKDEFNKLKTKWANDFRIFNQYVTDSEGKARSESMQKSFDLYAADANQVWTLMDEGNDADARSIIMNKSNVSFDQLINDMNTQMNFQDQGALNAATEAMDTHHLVLRQLIIFILIALLAGAILALLIARHISRPLVEVTKITQSVAEGELSLTLPEVKSRDEIGALSQAVGKMLHALREIIGEVLIQSERLAATSQELSAAAEEATASGDQVSDTLAQLAIGATNQAMSVKDTGIAIEQLSQNAQQVAENAGIVSQKSQKAAQAAELGALQAKNAVQKIKRIQDDSVQTAEAVSQLGDQSKQIGQIVDVIQGIANQTNLLALNAAIEAARAGEQGKGFAVVAEEVRKLAEQSALSTTEIANFISNIQRVTEHVVEVIENGKAEVSGGVEAVNLAGGSFQTIVEEVNIVVEQIQQVTEATQQMANGTTHVVSNVDSIGEIVEQTASSTKEVSAMAEEQANIMKSVRESSETLAKLGESLTLLVSKFKL